MPDASCAQPCNTPTPAQPAAHQTCAQTVPQGPAVCSLPASVPYTPCTTRSRGAPSCRETVGWSAASAASGERSQHTSREPGLTFAAAGQERFKPTPGVFQFFGGQHPCRGLYGLRSRLVRAVITQPAATPHPCPRCVLRRQRGDPYRVPASNALHRVSFVMADDAQATPESGECAGVVGLFVAC
jgi:hypothetical protein